MDKLLLVVENSFQITKLGVIVTPDASPDLVGSDKSGHVATVRLARPDGTEEVLQATFYWEHLNSAHVIANHFVCVLCDAKKGQAPPGTEVWLLQNYEKQ